MSAFPFIQTVLAVHDLLFQQLDALLECGIAAGFMMIRPLGALVCGIEASDMMRADLKEWQIPQA